MFFLMTVNQPKSAFSNNSIPTLLIFLRLLTDLERVADGS